MAANEIARAVLAVAVGLLLGSVLPADLLARRRHIDIRATGDGNPGTVNAFRALGWESGLVTAIYDLSVGIVAIEAAYLLRLPEGIAYLAGVATIVGHRFPIFRGLRGGGEGMAASAGLLVYAVALEVSRGWLSVAEIVVLVVILALTFAFTRTESAPPIVMLPVLVIMVTLGHADWPTLALTTVTALNIWVVQAVATRRWLASRQTGPAHHHTRA